MIELTVPTIPRSRIRLAALLILLAQPRLADDFHPPGGVAYAHTTGNVTILPGGRALKPMGSQIESDPAPLASRLAPKASSASRKPASSASGFPSSNRTKTPGNSVCSGLCRPTNSTRKAGPPNSLTAGKARPTGSPSILRKSVWIAEGDIRQNSSARRVQRRAPQTPQHQRRGFSQQLHSGSGHRSGASHLYVLDQANERLVLIDTVKDTILASVATGRMPFTIALSPDRNTVYVANIGVFRYLVALARSPRRDVAAVLATVPPLGDPNNHESNSVCVIDVMIRKSPPSSDMDSHRRRDWEHRVPNGAGQPSGIAVGGSAPTGILAVDDRVYVSNAHSDSITVISAAENKVLG